MAGTSEFFKCKLCGHVTKAHNSMLSHLKIKHGKTGRGLTKEFIIKTSQKPVRASYGKSMKDKCFEYTCTICKHTLGTDAGIIGHIKKQHGKSNPVREFYTRKEISTSHKSKTKKTPKAINSKLLDILGNGKEDIKFIITVDLEINLSTNSIKILPCSGHQKDGSLADV